MAQSGSQRKSAAEAARPTGLTALRSQIDKIDRELVGLVNARAELARQIGPLTQSSGQVTYDPSREESVLDESWAGSHRCFSQGVRRRSPRSSPLPSPHC